MTLVVPAATIEEVRQHALEAAPGFEVGGILLVDDHEQKVVLYTRCKNRATEPGRASFSGGSYRDERYYTIRLHSHPAGSELRPSQQDLVANAYALFGFQFAIYGVSQDEIRVFRVGVNPDGSVGGFRSLPVIVE